MKNNLESQITSARQEVSAEGYPMSIGELTNLYKEKELIIRPEFQRFFRWTDLQKSRLVESLLLGIPLPSIFVSQTENGQWELVDGLQRVATILELQGELLDKDGKRLPQLNLQSTKYLPSLAGKKWEEQSGHHSLTAAQRLDVKRSKLDIKIIKRGSSPNAKFDLFQRLNSYGSTLTAQEMRSALLVAASPDFFKWLESLAAYENFVNVLQLSESLLDERYDLELVLRFLMLHNWPRDRMTQAALDNFSDVLDEYSVRLAKIFPRGSRKLDSLFKKTFDLLSYHGDENVFRRWDKERKSFRGSFLNSSYEVLGLGLGYCLTNKLPYRNDFIECAKEFWQMPEVSVGFATGKATKARLVTFIPLGRKLMNKPS